MQFEHPLWLLVLLLVTFSLFLYWKQMRFVTEEWVLISLRSLQFICLIFALAGLQIVTPVTELSTVFVVDRSDSQKNQSDEMKNYIQDALEESKVEDEFGIVTFGAGANVERNLRHYEEEKVEFLAESDGTATNLASGLSVAGSLLDSTRRSRVVLLTDGNETTHDGVARAEELARQGITVDVKAFQPDSQEDAAITSFSVPNNVYTGETASLELNVESNKEMKASVRIYGGNEQIIEKEVQLEAGVNRFTFNDEVSESGFKEYKAEVYAITDAIPENNEAYGISNIKGTPRILVVEGEKGEGDNAVAALDSTDLFVKQITPELLPTSLTGLAEYQSILFANVSGSQVSEDQMTMIESAVRDFGTGFIMTGGKNSFGLGGYFKTPLENILPVDMDVKGKKEIPSLGLVIVLDRSGSMTGYKLDIAKEAAARSVELLRERDTFGFIAFDDQPWEIIETKPIKDKKNVIETVTSVTAGGGTEIFSSLSLAYQRLSPLELKRKHIILLTDGQANNQPDYEGMMQASENSDITLSTVAIGSDADQILLEDLAGYGEGRFYNVSDASTIPSILARETALTTRTYIEDNPFFPVVTGSEVQPYVEDGVPRMNAYIATTPKGRASVLLQSEKEDPVLAKWQYGLGKTIAWTSDLSGEWSGGWPSWKQWSPFWNNIVTSTLPQFEGDTFELTSTKQGEQATVSISAYEEGGGDVTGKIIDSAGNEVPSQFRITAPGEYELTFKGETGVYFAQVEQRENGEVSDAYQSGFVIPYNEEYRPVELDQKKLEAIAEAGNGRVLTESDQVFLRNIPVGNERQSIWKILLLLTLFLFIADIALRRFGLVKVNWKSKVARSDHAQTNVNTQKFERLKSASKTSSTKRPFSKVDPPKENVDKKASPPSDKTNNSDRMTRLLDAKNKRK
ncbi:VWA domain-containing protein [Guptibacillus algicola]|uniref:VWA domain-containing protein n=1 Tax=Guptibacillus algicola TaxID=225844 RepID=UPI001CD48025|nr:VWA domain-containing protein [Alkalihalobacillus algicola]MCA0989055.1 VWA domain-containing protein [Alkalihalobacillus algicola]